MITPKTPSEVIGERVRALREMRGMTQSDLAKRLKPHGMSLHKDTTRMLEAGDRKTTVAEVFALAYVLDTSPLALLAPAGHGNVEPVAVTPSVILERPANLRRWIRGLIAIGGQNGHLYYRLHEPIIDATEFFSVAASHQQLVEEADRVREALTEGDRAAVAMALFRITGLVDRIHREHTIDDIASDEGVGWIAEERGNE